MHIDLIIGEYKNDLVVNNKNLNSIGYIRNKQIYSPN